MSKNILFVTLGSRDLRPLAGLEGLNLLEPGEVQADRNAPGQFIFPGLRDSSAKLKSLLAEGHREILDHIAYPIIKPGIDYLLKVKGLNRIDKIIMVVTDQSQNEEIDPRYKRGDTVHLKKILEEKLRKDYAKNQKDFKQRPGFVGIQKIAALPITQNPIYFDQMYEYMDRELEKPQYMFGADDSIYLLAQGGVDAANLALTMKCIEKYPQLVQLAKPESLDMAMEVNTPRKFRKNYRRQGILHALDNYHYLAVMEYAGEDKDFVFHQAGFAYSCLSFDFEQARYHLDRLFTIDDAYRDRYTQYALRMSQLENDFEAKLREMYLSAKVRYHQGSYADFLVKIFAMSENIIRPAIENIMGVSAAFRSDKNYASWVKAIDEKPELKMFLDQKKVEGGRKLRYDEPTLLPMVAILEYFETKLHHEIPYLNLQARLNSLRTLRNKVAHNLAGVNGQDIEEALSQKNVNPESSHTDLFFQEMDAYFEVERFGFYDKFNDQLTKRLFP